MPASSYLCCDRYLNRLKMEADVALFDDSFKKKKGNYLGALLVAIMQSDDHKNLGYHKSLRRLKLIIFTWNLRTRLKYLELAVREAGVFRHNGTHLRAPLTIAMYGEFRGVSSIGYTRLPRDAGLSDSCTSERCSFFFSPNRIRVFSAEFPDKNNAFK